jgi:hypothetical protein
MVLLQYGNETISRKADENHLPKLEGFSEQSLVADVQNVERPSDRDRLVPKLGS